MKVLLQWAQRDPNNWIPFDLDLIAGAWESLPARAEPSPGQLGGANNVLGWINNLMVQGVRFNGADHYAVERVMVGLEAGIKVTVWNDDPDDWPVGERHARVWTILPLAPDPNLGGAINTRQSQVLYAEGPRFTRNLAAPPQNTTVLPWVDFVPPATAITRHGVQLTDAKYAQHLAAQAEWGWRHWTDHLPDSEVVALPDGRRILLDQRPQGRYSPSQFTLTWYQRNTDLAQGWIVATHEDSLLGTAGAGETESVTTGSSVVICWAFATPSNEPNSADWPNGAYRAQLDVTAASAALIYQVKDDTGALTTRKFDRLASDVGSILEALGGPAGTGSGTGLKLFSITVNFAAGADTDRYGFGVVADGVFAGDAITIRFSADAFADGPWTTGPEPNWPGERVELQAQAVMSRF